MIREPAIEKILAITAENLILDPELDAKNCASAMEALEKIHKGLMLPKEALGFSADIMGALEGMAYNYYNAGKYNEAIRTYKTLRILDPMQYKYTLGIALAFHRMEMFYEALANYALSSHLAPNDPFPYFHMADCLLKMNNKKGAMQALKKAVNRSGDMQEFADIKKRAKMIYFKIKEELGVEEAEEEKLEQ